jgi:uncharacterized protein (DUF2126 family)
MRGYSIGQCTYLVEPPDGRTYAARPDNAAEADGRRMDRFQVGAPALSPMAAPEEEMNALFPMTLDLRLPPRGQKTQIETPGLVS